MLSALERRVAGIPDWPAKDCTVAAPMELGEGK